MRTAATIAFLLFAATQLHAASGRQSPPPGTFNGAPSQFTKFTASELTGGFLTLAFGSDLRLGAKPRGIRKFGGDISVFVASSSGVDRKAEMEKIILEYGRVIPYAITTAPNEDDANLVVRLIDEKNFGPSLIEAFGEATARAFIAKTDPQCMTSVKSQSDGTIGRTVSFVIVDKGDRVFLDCAYHELLHAFGLSNHDQRNPWTTLNQTRMVGYLTVYDRALLTLLYDPAIKPGMTREEVRALLPALIGQLPFGR